MIERTVAVITGKGEVRVVSNTTELQENEVLIKVHVSLISPGTEMTAVKNFRDNPDLEFPDTIFGYANAGEIVEVKGDGKGLKPGMRVAAMGGGAASHATYTCAPVNLVVPIPDEVTYEQAAYACLAATALQGIRRTEPQLGEYGMVLGLGIVGNLSAQLYQLCGARVLGWDGMESRLAIAAQCGIAHTVNFRTSDPVAASVDFAAPYGMDFAMFAFGGPATQAYEQVKRCMKLAPDTHEMGRVILIGGCTVAVGGGAASGNLDIRASSRTGPGYHDEAYERGQDYPGVFVPFTTQRNLREVIRLIAEKRLRVDEMTTHRMPLADAGKAADLLINSPDRAQGIILQMPH